MLKSSNDVLMLPVLLTIYISFLRVFMGTNDTLHFITMQVNTRITYIVYSTL